MMPTLSKMIQHYAADCDRATMKALLKPNPLLSLIGRNAEAKMSDTIKEGAMDDQSNNAHVSEVAHWPELVPPPLAKKTPLCSRQIFSWSVPHDRTTFDAEYLGQPDGSLHQVPEILVTDEMKSLGFQAAIKMQPRAPLLVETLEAIYRAMYAVAPEWTWDREQRYRNATSEMMMAVNNRRHELEVERDDLKTQLDAALDQTETALKGWRGMVKERNELRRRLALQGESVAFPADPPPNHTTGDLKPEPKREPKPIPAGALQPTTTDRRRIGG